VVIEQKFFVKKPTGTTN